MLREHLAQQDALRKLHPAESMPYRVDEWDFMTDLKAAQTAWSAYCAAKPYDRLTLRRGAHVLNDQPWSDKRRLTRRPDPASSRTLVVRLTALGL